MEKVIVAIFLITTCLFGCGTTKFVEVPHHTPQRIDRPILEISNLKEGDSAATVIQAHRLSIITLQKYASELEILIWGKED